MQDLEKIDNPKVIISMLEMQRAAIAAIVKSCPNPYGDGQLDTLDQVIALLKRLKDRGES